MGACTGVLRNATTGEILAANVRYADSWWARLAGFIPRRVIAPDDGLWFRNCWVIHTLGMRARIDLIFLDGENRILRTQRRVRLNHPAIGCAGARNVIELGAGALEGRDLLAGDRLALE